MRELPQQYLDNMTGEEWFNYHIDNGVIPPNIDHQVKDIIDSTVSEIENELKESYEDGLVAAYDQGYQEGLEAK